MTRFKGVDHVGLGVADMTVAISFYRQIGFQDVCIDYTGIVPGIGRCARIVLLENPQATSLGPGRIKLVEVLDDSGPPPTPKGRAWGEIGVCELCLHTPGLERVFPRLVALGAVPLMAPVAIPSPIEGRSVKIAYVEDPWKTKIQLIEWVETDGGCASPRIEGVNHVAFGVTDIQRTQNFYVALGFTALLFESTEFFEPMAPWYGLDIPAQRMMGIGAEHGAGIEPVVLAPAGPDCRGEWGHLGAYEFAVGVDDLDRGVEYLQALGIELRHEPATLESGRERWKYVYFHEPDGLHVSLVETSN